MSTLLPVRRETGLIVEDLAHETLIYDLPRHKAHCLNRTARLVWQCCDGKTTVAGASARLQRELQAPIDESVVWLAVDQLAKARLVAEAPVRPAGQGPTTRRALIGQLGLAAASVPLVTSLLAPTAAAGSSVCSGTTNCTLKHCSSGTCQSFAGTCRCMG